MLTEIEIIQSAVLRVLEETEGLLPGAGALLLAPELEELDRVRPLKVATGEQVLGPIEGRPGLEPARLDHLREVEAAVEALEDGRVPSEPLRLAEDLEGGGGRAADLVQTGELPGDVPSPGAARSPEQRGLHGEVELDAAEQALVEGALGELFEGEGGGIEGDGDRPVDPLEDRLRDRLGGEESGLQNAGPQVALQGLRLAAKATEVPLPQGRAFSEDPTEEGPRLPVFGGARLEVDDPSALNPQAQERGTPGQVAQLQKSVTVGPGRPQELGDPRVGDRRRDLRFTHRSTRARPARGTLSVEG
jgi:hypothetical protein